MKRALPWLLLLTACGKSGFELSVDLRTDFVPGYQFVGARTELLGPSGEAVDTVDQLVSTGDDYLSGARIAILEGLPAGTSRIRVTLLGGAGRVVATREAAVELTSSYAVTVLVSSNCRDVTCPVEGADPSLTACVGGICVDPRCSPETPEYCAEFGCATDDQCDEGSDCTTGTCIDAFCFLQPNRNLCMPGFYCDIDEGCLAESMGDGGVCMASETECTDGLDDDCDGMVDCADPDCAEISCDDGSVCTESDRCIDGVCSGDALDCDDNNECTTDSCDPTSGCMNTNNTESCDDGVWCNGRDLCADGECTHVEPPCTEFCSEVRMVCDSCADNADCGEVSVSDWSGCGGFAGTCDETGTRTRTRTTPRCEEGMCVFDTAQESESCNRTVRNGTSCGSFWQRCCGGSCTNLANNDSACGSCAVQCTGGTRCSADNGGYACGNCSTNATCRSIYDSSATCYLAGGNRCNCQCPGNGVCANGGCGANFFCHDVSGNNYCSPTR